MAEILRRASTSIFGGKPHYSELPAIRIAELPPSLRPVMEAFDDNNDGAIDVHDLKDFARAFMKQRQDIRWMRTTLLMNVGLTVVFLLGVAALSWTVANITRPMDVEGTMLVSHATQSPVSVGQTLIRSNGVSSDMDDVDFRRLRYVTMGSSSGATTSLLVQGFVRLPTDGSVVLFTPVGHVKVGVDSMTMVEGGAGQLLREVGIVREGAQATHWHVLEDDKTVVDKNVNTTTP